MKNTKNIANMPVFYQLFVIVWYYLYDKQIKHLQVDDTNQSNAWTLQVVVKYGSNWLCIIYPLGESCLRWC